MYDITMGQHIRKLLIAHLQPINPHADIAPTSSGKCEVYIRPVLSCSKGDLAAPRHEKDQACIYEPDGRCTHMLPPTVVAALYERFKFVQTHHPDVHQRLQAGTFAEELHKLVTRYSGKTTCGKVGPNCDMYTIDTGDQRAMPRLLRDRLLDLLGANKERFTSPLTVCHTVQDYWTAHKQDQAFGANFDAYKTKWTGASLACPDFNQKAAHTAVEWALRSAIHNPEPTLTLLLLPTYTKHGTFTTYMQWIRKYPEHCKVLATLPRSKTILDATCNNNTSPTLRWNTNVIAIGNLAGFEKHLPYWESSNGVSWRQSFENTLNVSMTSEKLGTTTHAELHQPRAEWWTRPPTPATTPICTDLKPSLTIDKKFIKRPHDHRRKSRSQDIIALVHHPHAPLGATARALKQATQRMSNSTQAPPLKHDWRNFVYTDGSVLTNKKDHEPGIGAAVYIPANQHTGQPSLSIAIKCKYDNLDREHPTCVNTINRAELAAIHVALETGHTEKHADPALHVATDSLTSIHQINKAVLRPQDMREHRHLSIIEGIIRQISTDGTDKLPKVIHIWKVKSHTGVVGNEYADTIAVAAAKDAVETLGPEVEQDIYDRPSNQRQGVYWPYTEEIHVAPKPLPTHAPRAAEEPNHVDAHSRDQPRRRKAVPSRIYTPVANLAESLKHLVHEMHKLGSSNTSSVYFQSWQTMHGQLDPRHSHTFMTSAAIKSRPRKLALQYRYGFLPTFKLLKRYKKTTTDTCPLCHGPDGGHHAVSACPSLSKPVTMRHNKAGAAIVEAIYNGSKGHSLLTADVGLQKRQRELGLPSLNLPRRIPADVLPSSIPAALRTQLTRHSIPDALLCHLSKDQTHRKYIVVEVKYCRDTRTADQELRATDQHAQLIESIRKYDPKADVVLCTLLLGVGGSIYKSFRTRMQEHLGVSGASLDALCAKLHRLAIEGLENIWKYRQARLTRSRRRHTPQHQNSSKQIGTKRRSSRLTHDVAAPSTRKRPKR